MVKSEEPAPRTSKLLTCAGQGGKEKIKGRIILFLILWLAFEIIAYIITVVYFGSFLFLWDTGFSAVWVIIEILSILGWLSFAILVYYTLLFFFTC